MNLYETLGVAPNATKDEIKRAAKAKMQRYHPDKGGTKEEFAAVNKAKRLLTNDSARARYDETGSTAPEQPAELTDEQHAVIILGKLFIAFLEKDEHNGDPLYAVRVEIAKGMREGPAMIANHKGKIAKAERTLKKYLKQAAGKPGYLQNSLTTYIKHLNEMLAQMELAHRIGPIMLEILKDYSWQGDIPTYKSGILTLEGFIQMQSKLYNNLGS